MRIFGCLYQRKASVRQRSGAFFFWASYSYLFIDLAITDELYTARRVLECGSEQNLQNQAHL